MEKRGQLAVEYLMIIGFSIFVITILMIVYADQSQTQGSELIYSQINRIGHKITDTAEEVYYKGTDSRKRLKMYIPSNVINATVYTNSVVFNVDTGSGLSQMDYSSSVPLQGQISTTQGVKYISVISKGTFTCIVEDGDPECP